MRDSGRLGRDIVPGDIIHSQNRWLKVARVIAFDHYATGPSWTVIGTDGRQVTLFEGDRA